MSLKCRYFALFAWILAICVTKNVAAAPIQSTPKTFAVFMASFNSSGGLVRGGVCGTAFFISPTEAVTAYHVLAEKSFKPLPGFEHVRIWLVHEGYRAIEIHPKFLTYEPGRDRTVLKFPKSDAVASRFVFATDPSAKTTGEVVSEGFVANTSGPTLIRHGATIDVAAVPSLQRLHLTGMVLRHAAVNLNSPNIHLRAEPSFQLSYQPVVGISGGPVLSHGKVIAMNSFAEPTTFRQTWAVQLGRP